MFDQQWIQNLTSAEYKNKKWEYNQKNDPLEVIAYRQKSVLTNLHAKLCEVLEVYNNLADPQRKIRMMTKAMPIPSIVLLMHSLQCQILMKNESIHITIQGTKNYKTGKLQHATLRPHADNFGTVLWQHSNQVLLSEDMLIKLVLEDLNRLYFETHV